MVQSLVSFSTPSSSRELTRLCFDSADGWSQGTGSNYGVEQGNCI